MRDRETEDSWERQRRAGRRESARMSKWGQGKSEREREEKGDRNVPDRRNRKNKRQARYHRSDRLKR